MEKRYEFVLYDKQNETQLQIFTDSDGIVISECDLFGKGIAFENNDLYIQYNENQCMS